MKFDSPFGKIVLTDERKMHIFAFHPNVKSAIVYFAETLANPDFVVRSVHDEKIVLCYRFINRKKKHLAIVVKTGAHPFIVTAYLAKKPKGGILYP